MEQNNKENDPPLFDSQITGRNARDYFMEYDEDGSLALAKSLAALAGGNSNTRSSAGDDPLNQPLKANDLNGSWYLQLTPQGAHTLIEIRGSMRIEVASPKLRVSGDIYVRKPSAVEGPIEILRPITERPLFFDKNWYPQFSFDQYSWYFRSLGVTYQSGKLVFKFERNLWNPTTQEFIKNDNSGKDTGFMEIDCRETGLFTHPLLPQPTLRITGIARLGGETYDLVATKTSPFYRGCALEVDVMTNRSFPLSAKMVNGTSISFTSIYRAAGFDCAVTIDQTEVAEDSDLSDIELQTALTTNSRKLESDVWQLWLLIGSSQGETFGVMFDDIAPYREGVVGFFDPQFKDFPFIAQHARNKKLGDVPEAFLRTLVHEAGHAFNLFHPKHDVHVVPLGTTIMNQTGDVMSFASASNPYPLNVTFAFDEHSRNSLIHSPDPQIAPGWKRFGWGHGSLSSGIAEPVDAAGLQRNEPVGGDLSLEIAIPNVNFRGQFVMASFRVTNNGDKPHTISSALNLSQGDLRLLVKPPVDELHDVRDVILSCGDRPTTQIQPGESLIGNAQIFYTNLGLTFRQTGRYYVSAEFEVGDSLGTVVRSNTSTVVIRAPATAEEEGIAGLTMDLGVGRAFAFGDYGTDTQARIKLEELAEKYAHTETGAAAGLTLANATNRDLRNLFSKNVIRNADAGASQSYFDAVADQHDPGTLVQLATAVAAPTEVNAPVLRQASDYLENKTAGQDELAEVDDNESNTAYVSADTGIYETVEYGEALDSLNSIRRTFVQR